MHLTQTLIRLEWTWSITQSEANQKEKKRYHILTHTYVESRKITEESMCEAPVEMQTQRTDLWRWGGGHRKERAAGRHTHIPMCKTHSLWGFAVWRRAQTQCSGMGCGGAGPGGERKGSLQGGGRMYAYGWFMVMYGRDQHSIVSNYPQVKTRPFK